MPDLLPHQSDAYATLAEVKDLATGAPVDDATVTVTLFKRNGMPVTNAIDLPAPFSAGKYRATIPADAAVTLGWTYECCAKAVKNGLEVAFWQEVVVQKLSA